jgi:hypothetical protein
MQDPNGYSELVIHPPPLNILSVVIWPCIIRKSLMKKAAECFSKFVFWVENSAYIVCFFFYELFLCPYIYFKVFVNIMILSNFLRLVPLMLFWMVVGPFVLLFSIGKDLFFFIKILCDYQDEED